MPVASGDGGSLYTIQYEGESRTEFDKFLENKEVAQEHLSFSRLAAKLNEMVNEYGFVREFFKEKEGKRWDYVVALSDGKLRLYCLRTEKFPADCGQRRGEENADLPAGCSFERFG
ncbi:hypothetical protein [Chlorobaculum sp. 24CR]|uniref:hypothetical protein n=1 Tax=Chlorobaculum sp. 24CR TaxID=2508878 RepID=UPI00100AED53|nr:hypothetical protein [Chlorobaculum sp. 24CR]